ncbi:hypothetical protein FF1_024865 [Malus domestica]
MEEMNDGGQLDLEYDFYSETCPETETIVRSTMTQITLTRRMSLLRCCASSSMTASFSFEPLARFGMTIDEVSVSADGLAKI